MKKPIAILLLLLLSNASSPQGHTSLQGELNFNDYVAGFLDLYYFPSISIGYCYHPVPRLGIGGNLETGYSRKYFNNFPAILRTSLFFRYAPWNRFSIDAGGSMLFKQAKTGWVEDNLGPFVTLNYSFVDKPAYQIGIRGSIMIVRDPWGDMEDFLNQVGVYLVLPHLELGSRKQN